jgi:molybdenum cofactor biosynthesis enzyme MoaA
MTNIEVKNVQSVSLLAATKQCDARCPFCVAEMTPLHGLTTKEVPIPLDRLLKTLEYARLGNAQALMITSKGEPTLFPEHISLFLNEAKKFEEKTGFCFRKKELQSNGIRVATYPQKYDAYLRKWRELGLDTYIVSIVHYDPEINRQTYLPYRSSYIDLGALTYQLHQYGFKVRLGCIAYNGGIDSSEKLANLIEFTRRIGADELTVRPVAKPDKSRNSEVYEWVAEHELTPAQFTDMHDFLEKNGRILMQYPFGGTIYRLGDGTTSQDVCLTNALTSNDENHTRQIIFHLNGDIATDWTEDAQLLP